MGGKSDYKKINNWYGDTETRSDVEKFYSQSSDVPRHKKKKAKKSKKRSDHKHIYTDVLINSEGWGHLILGKKCEICGHLEGVRWSITYPIERNGHTYYRVYTDEEVLTISPYKDLPIVEGEV